ncbi:uncharacterized protein LOC113554800 [Rhopalosiphum maidis]|uniref:uncharacterized protein LOC113554800 n=1 Tax=Rhopalosiphum maidis TaxID=43146 RepID=UPI000EFFF867|nr:uncharacterized protein LOC113554800 [Rhopalosiphum maidis]
MLPISQGNKIDDCRCYGNLPKPIAEPSKVTRPTPCCPCPCPAEKCKVTLQTVQKLVEAENKDIELSELLGGITILDERRPKKKIIDMYDATSKENREDPENNVDPQYLAYIMKSIENGLSMKTDPIKVYEHLFSRGNLEAPLVALGPTAAISTEDMVVPLSPPTIVNVKDPEMETGSRLDTIIPRLNLAVAEAAEIDNVDDLQVLLGGSFPDKQTSTADDQEAPRDMLLETREPYQSAAVLRGSTPPNWFPGYNVALPNTAHPALENDPEAILDEAWFHSQPLSLKLEEKGAKLIGS